MHSVLTNPNRLRRGIFSAVVGLGMAVVVMWVSMSAQVSSASPDWGIESSVPSGLGFTHTTFTVFLPLIASCWCADAPPFGIQFYSTLTNSRGLGHAADAGARWIRVPVSWGQVEPNNTTPDGYFWSNVDYSVTNATNRDIELILTLSGQPSWAAIYAMGPVTNTADIQEFMGALVERYDGDGLDDAPGSPRVRYFEIYNEPDNFNAGLAGNGGWGYWGHNGAGYAQLLQALYPVVKTASPQAQIVFGGIALDWFEEQGGPFDSHFLDDVLAACQGQACFDIVNFHYYPPFRPNWEAFGPDIIGKANYVRQKLADYGLSNTPLICTETSWVSGSGWGSDELQSRYIAKVYARGKAADLDIVIWYTISDSVDESLPGLLDESFQPKVSYYAFVAMTRMLKGAAYQRALDPAETGSSQLVGYVFDKCNHRLDIVWTEDNTPYDPDDDPQLPLTVNAVMLTITDKFGTTQSVSDIDDGWADGQITVYVGGSPLYLEYNP